MLFFEGRIFTNKYLKRVSGLIVILMILVPELVSCTGEKDPPPVVIPPPDQPSLPLEGFVSGDNFLYPRNSKLFFLMNYPGIICVFDPAAGSVYNLLNIEKFNNTCGNFDISADGGKIVFCSDRYGKFEIFLANLDMEKNTINSTIKKIIYDDRAEDPRFSHDGRSIVYKKHNDIFIYDLESGLSTAITNTGEEEWAPVFSPSDTIIAFGRGTDNTSPEGEIVLYYLRSEEERTVTLAAFNDWFPAFSNRGDLIFVSRRGATCGDDIYSIKKENLADSNPADHYEILPGLNQCNGAGISDADPSAVIGSDSTLIFVSDRSLMRYAIWLYSFPKQQSHFLISHESGSLLGPVMIVAD